VYFVFWAVFTGNVSWARSKVNRALQAVFGLSDPPVRFSWPSMSSVAERFGPRSPGWEGILTGLAGWYRGVARRWLNELYRATSFPSGLARSADFQAFA